MSGEAAPATLHVVTTDIHLHISGYSSARGILCACVFLVATVEAEVRSYSVSVV